MRIPQIARPALPLPANAQIQKKTDTPHFSDVLKGAISDVSGLQAEAQNAIEAFVRGEPIELHQVMAAAEEASLSLELLVEFRNRLTDAYRTIVSLQ